MRVTDPVRLLVLRTTGFRKLRPGRIHMRCWTCGRKQSNMPRESYDPTTAVLAQFPCPRCADTGAKGVNVAYFDARGAEVFQYE